MLKSKLVPIAMALTLLVGGTALASPLTAKACASNQSAQEDPNKFVTLGAYPGLLSTALAGTYNPYVKQVQQLLYNLENDFWYEGDVLISPNAEWNYDPRGIDGYFGTYTANAVKEFQRAHGLTQDGKVGPATWSVLQQHVY